MRGLLAALAVTAGCNTVLGLDPVGSERDADVDAPSDRDDDGVPDAIDRCPDLADPRQHDEDEDGVGDGCDNCPHLANPDQADALEGATHDGIGDACDPNPDALGDQVMWFDAFDDGELDPRWALSIGDAWVEADDALVQATGTGLHILAAPGVTGQRLTAEVGLTITSSQPNVQRGFDLGLDYTSEQSAVLCAWRNLAAVSSGDALVIELRPVTAVTLGMATAPAIVESSQRIRARRTLTGTVAGVRCELVDRTNLGAGTTVVPGGLAFRVTNLGVRVEYLMVYDRLTSAVSAATTAD